MKIVSWNVNGLRACGKAGFLDWLCGCGADVVCLQEVRARPDQLPVLIAAPPGWHAAFAPAGRPGYSGVAILARRPWDGLDIGLGDPQFDGEGRAIGARFGALTVWSAYFPNGNGKDRDLSRIPFKLAFYEALLRRAALDERAVVAGDWNTAPAAIDLARPRENVATSGFRPEERAAVDQWLAAGWTDTFRALHPDRAGAYSWWSQRDGVRAKNIGWRIDLALCSAGARPYLRDAAIDALVTGSDHCPIEVSFDPAITA